MKKQKICVAATVCMLLVCVLLSGCATSGSTNSTDPAQKKPWELSEEAQLRLKQDYVEYMSFTNHSCTVEDVKMVVISQVDSGYAIVIGCKCGSIDLDASWDELYGDSAGELQFYMPNGWCIKLCKDGEFRTLNEAFNLRWIDYEQLRTIWDDYHAQFPKALETWQIVHGGLAELPERDPSGLDYEINDDGTTCTVTGMGACNDIDVVIPEYIDGYQVTAIGGMAFRNRIWITSVTMPDSVVSIGMSAFEDCMQLRSITLSNRLEHIAGHAFLNCQSLAKVTLPESVTSISLGAFKGCSSLTSFTIPEGVTSISAGLFSDCKNLVSVTIPAGVTSIGGWAFSNCQNLSSVTIPDGVTTLESNVFAGCASLTNVTIPANVTLIGELAFMGCDSLRSINIPDGVTEIAMHAFEGCRSLEQIVIPDSVTTIGDWAFADCTGMTSLTIGKGVANIGFVALRNCSGLLQITVSTENPAYHVDGNCLIETQSKKLLRAAKDGVIPSDGSVLHINDYAFCGQKDLQEIAIPEGVQSIGAYAFDGCTSLRRAYIPASMQAIESAFAHCDAMETIHYAGTQKQWYAIRQATYLGDGILEFIICCTDGEIEAK